MYFVMYTVVYSIYIQLVININSSDLLVNNSIEKMLHIHEIV